MSTFKETARMLKTPPRTLLEVYNSLPEGTLAELVNNSLVMEPAPDYYHQDVVMEIAFQIRNFADSNNLGKVIISPIDIYLDEENVFQPDIIFIAADRLDGLIKNGKIHGAPDLVVEVLSPGTQKKDRVQKKAVYEKFGVKEYWIVAPKTKKVMGFVLSEHKYTELTVKEGTIESALLGTTISF